MRTVILVVLLKNSDVGEAFVLAFNDLPEVVPWYPPIIPGHIVIIGQSEEPDPVIWWLVQILTGKPETFNPLPPKAMLTLGTGTVGRTTEEADCLHGLDVVPCPRTTVPLWLWIVMIEKEVDKALIIEYSHD